MFISCFLWFTRHVTCEISRQRYGCWFPNLQCPGLLRNTPKGPMKVQRYVHPSNFKAIKTLVAWQKSPYVIFMHTDEFSWVQINTEGSLLMFQHESVVYLVVLRWHINTETATVQQRRNIIFFSPGLEIPHTSTLLIKNTLVINWWRINDIQKY